MRLLLALLACATLAAPVSQAQGEALDPALALETPYLDGEAADGIDPRVGGSLAAPWSLTFASPAHAAAVLAQDGGVIDWALACPELDVLSSQSPIEHAAGQAAYQGIATIGIPADSWPAVRPLGCDLTGTFTGSSSTASASAPAEVLILFRGQLEVDAPMPEATAGPQKQLRFPLTVTNHGNARTVLHFEVRDVENGFLVIPPPVAVVEPGATLDMTVVVSTPFENGPNQGSSEFELWVTPVAADDETQSGAAVPVTLKAGVDGFYAPGPSPVLLLLAMTGLAAALRRR